MLSIGCAESSPEQEFERGLALASAGNHAAAVKVWSPLAAAGNLDAQLALADANVTGRGTPRDYQRALDLYRAAETQGSSRAQYALGLMHQHGDGVPVAPDKAAVYFRQAAQADHAKAKLRLAQAYQQGSGVARSLTQAYEWAILADAAGMQQAKALQVQVREQAFELTAEEMPDLLALAALLRRVREYESAEQLLLHFAQAGYAGAQAELGYVYWLQSKGRESFQSKQSLLEKVEHWSRLAAQQGNPSAMNNLGMLYKDGLGVRQDEQQALTWFKQATQRKEPRALVNLAYMYENGLGVDRDPQRAQALTRQAAELGSPQGQYYVGRRYQLGNGVEQSMTQALEWYQRAAAQGYADAQAALGGLYYLGQGVERDLARAFEWMGVGAANADGSGSESSTRELFARLILELDDQTIELGSERLGKTLPLAVAAGVGDPHALVDMGYLAAAKGDMARAKRLFTDSADTGFAEGLEALGGWYLLQGDRESLVSALQWYTVAAVRNGKSDDTLDSIARLLPRMTEQEIRAAQERAREWQQQRLGAMKESE